MWSCQHCKKPVVTNTIVNGWIKRTIGCVHLAFLNMEKINVQQFTN